MTIERTIKETITMAAITGHLKRLAGAWQTDKGDRLAVGLCHTVIPTREGILDVVDLSRNCSLRYKAVQHYVAHSPL